MLVDPTMRHCDGFPHALEPDAGALGVRLQRVEAAAPEALEGAFAAMAAVGAEAG